MYVCICTYIYLWLFNGNAVVESIRFKVNVSLGGVFISKDRTDTPPSGDPHLEDGHHAVTNPFKAPHPIITNDMYIYISIEPQKDNNDNDIKNIYTFMCVYYLYIYMYVKYISTWGTRYDTTTSSIHDVWGGPIRFTPFPYIHYTPCLFHNSLFPYVIYMSSSSFLVSHSMK